MTKLKSTLGLACFSVLGFCAYATTPTTVSDTAKSSIKVPGEYIVVFKSTTQQESISELVRNINSEHG
jgi:hypothetical protein